MWYAPLFIRKQFLESKTFSKTVGLLHKSFRHCETDNFLRKIVTPLLCIIFLDTRIFLKHWRNAHEIFRQCETENFWRKNVITPIMHKIFRYRKLFETLKGFPRKISGPVRQRIFDWKTWYSLSYKKFLDYQIFSKTLKRCPRVFSAMWDHSFLTAKWDTRPLFFRENFSKPWRKFPAVWDKQLSAGNCDTPNMHKTFRYPIFSETLKGCSRSFRHCETENFWRKGVMFSVYYAYIFSRAQFFWKIEGKLTTFFGTVRPNFFKREMWYSIFNT